MGYHDKAVAHDLIGQPARHAYAGDSGAQRTGVWPLIVVLAAIGMMALGGLASIDCSATDLIGRALGPPALLPQPSNDDAAGHTPPHRSKVPRFLPVSQPLANERVVATIGAIADVTCEHSDDEIPDARRPLTEW
jgi:hypothetical protein